MQNPVLPDTMSSLRVAEVMAAVKILDISRGGGSRVSEADLKHNLEMFARAYEAVTAATQSGAAAEAKASARAVREYT